jgi:hypothetical protein
MEHLRSEIREAAGRASEAVRPAAFVTFTNRLTQSAAATGMQTHDELAWRVQARRGGCVGGRAGRRQGQRKPGPAPHTSPWPLLLQSIVNALISNPAPPCPTPSHPPPPGRARPRRDPVGQPRHAPLAARRAHARGVVGVCRHRGFLPSGDGGHPGGGQPRERWVGGGWRGWRPAGRPGSSPGRRRPVECGIPATGRRRPRGPGRAGASGGVRGQGRGRVGWPLPLGRLPPGRRRPVQAVHVLPGRRRRGGAAGTGAGEPSASRRPRGSAAWLVQILTRARRPPPTARRRAFAPPAPPLLHLSVPRAALQTPSPLAPPPGPPPPPESAVRSIPKLGKVADIPFVTQVRG